MTRPCHTRDGGRPIVMALALAVAIVLGGAGGRAVARDGNRPSGAGADATKPPVTRRKPKAGVATAGATKAAPDLRVPSAARKAPKTKCAACHAPAGWRGAGFNHAATGFPLRGAHADGSCQACHGPTLGKPLARTCAGCHQDVHAGDLGRRCESCHDDARRNWATSFDADAHRRGLFPLTGRHALVPCRECHKDGTRDRTFTRLVVPCIDCHRADYDRTAGSSVDHVAAGFSTACRTCHQPFRFKPARFPGHDRCFQIDGGEHAGIGCLSCHSRLPMSLAPGTCATNTATCTRCHGCSKVEGEHRRVAGYQCKERKCYECHRFATGD